MLPAVSSILKLSIAWRMMARMAYRVNGEQRMTLFRRASSMSERSFSLMKA